MYYILIITLPLPPPSYFLAYFVHWKSSQLNLYILAYCIHLLQFAIKQDHYPGVVWISHWVPCSFLSVSYHYSDVTMGAITFQITRLTGVYPTVSSDTDQRKHQRSASLAFVRGIQRSPVNSPHKWPITRKMFPFDDVSWTGQRQQCTCN